MTISRVGRAALGALLVLPSCYVLPHVTEKYPAVEARVVDECTGAPVPGVEVEYSGYPATRTMTDRDGRFRIEAAYQWHAGYDPGMCTGDWPRGSTPSNRLEIRKAEFDARGYAVEHGDPKNLQPDIALRPERARLEAWRIACSFFPHAVLDRPDVEGIVIESRSSDEIAGAEVELEGFPGSRTTTRRDGSFRIAPTYALHPGLLLGGRCSPSEWPENYASELVLRVRKPGFETASLVLELRDWDPVRAARRTRRTQYVDLSRTSGASTAR
jgi:hypothetical protein